MALTIFEASLDGAQELACCLPDDCLTAGGTPGAYGASCSDDLDDDGGADTCDECTLCLVGIFSDDFESGDTSAWD